MRLLCTILQLFYDTVVLIISSSLFDIIGNKITFLGLSMTHKTG